MDKHTMWEFAVEGKNSFPLDMLRYDSCWPNRESEIGRMGATMMPARFRSSGDEPVVVHLQGLQEPTEGRWRSFGWEVVSAKRLPGLTWAVR